MNTASKQDTYDHMLGSGALSYSWWRDLQVTVDPESNDNHDWAVKLSCEDGDGETKSADIDHRAVLKAARFILGGNGSASAATQRECRNLIFDADEADFDCDTADEVLQVMVLGEVVFG